MQVTDDAQKGCEVIGLAGPLDCVIAVCGFTVP